LTFAPIVAITFFALSSLKLTVWNLIFPRWLFET